MSVRRLADASVQPARFAFTKAMQGEVKTWIKKYPKGRQQSAVIPLLMLAQEQDGWVTKAAIEHVADMLEMPYIRVLEVATFYTQFQLKPVGTRAHVQVCGTTPCLLMGSEALMDVCRSKIHPEQFHTNADGTLSWEEVECLGACVNAPMVMIFKDTYEDLTPERLGEIIDAFEAGKGAGVTTGPQTQRWFSAPATGFTSLANGKTAGKVAPSKAVSPKPVAGSKAAAPAAAVPPSNSAKPKTASLMTAPAIKSPSKVKASVDGEKAASVAPPKAKSAKAVAVAPKAAKSAVKADKAPAKPAAQATKPAAKTVAAGKVDQPKAKPTKTAASKPAAAKPSVRPSLDDVRRPKGIERPKKVDDLKLISGVGPKIEQTLHDLGVFTFAQIAAWTKDERAWADGYLDFHGRIEREDWVKQASALAKGGVREYVRVFGKKPV